MTPLIIVIAVVVSAAGGYLIGHHAGERYARRRILASMIGPDDTTLSGPTIEKELRWKE